MSNSGASVIDSDLEEFLDLPTGVLDRLGNGNATEGSAITFTAEAGDVLTFYWNFLTNEFTDENSTNNPFNDFAFYSITGSLDSFIDFTPDLSDTYYVGVSSFNNSNYDPSIEGSGTGDSSGFYDLFLTINELLDESEFNIEVNFIDDSLTPSQQAVFEVAANRWEEIITADVPDNEFRF